jgi:hypothetical protein
MRALTWRFGAWRPRSATASSDSREHGLPRSKFSLVWDSSDKIQRIRTAGPLSSQLRSRIANLRALPVSLIPRKLVIDGLPVSAYWRIYCRAAERGRSVNDEIVATLNAGNSDVAPDVEARLVAAGGFDRTPPSSIGRTSDAPQSAVSGQQDLDDYLATARGQIQIPRLGIAVRNGSAILNDGEITFGAVVTAVSPAGPAKALVSRQATSHLILEGALFGNGYRRGGIFSSRHKRSKR